FLLLAMALTGIYMAGISIWAQSSDKGRRRRHEIGVRAALGARPYGIARAILGRGLAMASIEACIGALVAWWFSRVMGSLFHGIAPGVSVFVAPVVAILALVLAVSLCALRPALRSDPRQLMNSSRL
ncbi:MAG: FtsX-like permease family protein, partial [Terriglobales bacterium]